MTLEQADSSLEGTQEFGDSEGSEAGDNQKGSSQAEYVTVTEFNKIRQQLESLRRGEQSAADKAVKPVAKRLESIEGDLKALLQSAAKQGKSASEVLADVEKAEEQETRDLMREMARAFKDGKFPVPSVASAQDGVDIDAVISEFGLDPEDRRTRAFATQSFSSVEQAQIAAAKLVRQIINTPAPSAADRTAPQGNVARAVANVDKLQREFDDKAKNAKGMALINLKMEYRKKGLDIS